MMCPQRRHETERVDGEEILAFPRALCLGVDLDKTGVGASLVDHDSRRHRAGERGEIKVHWNSAVEFCTEVYEITPAHSLSRVFYKVVQKAEKWARPDAAAKRRGRPRAYEPGRALQQATATFWKQGYSGTSLDDLADATGMNRRSVYG